MVPASQTEEVEAKSDFFQTQQSGSAPGPNACIAIRIVISISTQILLGYITLCDCLCSARNSTNFVTSTVVKI